MLKSKYWWIANCVVHQYLSFNYHQHAWYYEEDITTILRIRDENQD